MEAEKDQLLKESQTLRGMHIEADRKAQRDSKEHQALPQKLKAAQDDIKVQKERLRKQSLHIKAQSEKLRRHNDDIKNLQQDNGKLMQALEEAGIDVKKVLTWLP